MDEGKRKLWIERALALGASGAWVIGVDQLVMDPRTRLKCRIPLCSSYGRNLMCPPFVPSFRESEEAIKKYEWALLVKLEVSFEGEADRQVAYSGAVKLHKLVNALEKEAFQAGYRFAAGLIGGTCRLCERCVAETGGTRCRYPFEARPSMEAMGIDVLGTLDRLGLVVPQFPPGTKVEWIGLVLLG
ncbi:MAG: DUF2284 domain-containing protein [Bacillota bacterium]